MRKYRKKPVIIEAFQWLGFDRESDKYVGGFLASHVNEQRICKHCKRTMRWHGWINTLEGGHIVCPGDYIIIGIKGEKYPCKPDIFHKTYERIKEDVS